MYQQLDTTGTFHIRPNNTRDESPETLAIEMKQEENNVQKQLKVH